jgi:2-dehydropantoate 2-reductase
MRIAIVGSGGVGGGFGAALAHAGADVTFIARGAHLAAMQKDGLRVDSVRGNTHLRPTKATSDPKAVGPVDYVIFCVKLWDVESAGEAIKPLVGKDTAVVPLQNGVCAPERLVAILGEEHVMGGVAQISATIGEPGLIRQTGTFMRMVFGELDGKKRERGEALAAMCAKAGFDSAHSDQILTELWMKFILLATNASVMATIRQPIGKIREDADIIEMMRAGYRETVNVGRARGVAIPEDAVDRTVATSMGLPAALLPSMAVDLMRGNRIELPWLSGKVVELGKQLGVPTPTHSFLLTALKPYVMGAPA